MHLQTPVRHKNLMPICLPAADEDFRQAEDCFASGWGHFSGSILMETGKMIPQKDLKDVWDELLDKKIEETNIGERIIW